MAAQASLRLGLVVTLSLGFADLAIIDLVLAPRLAERGSKGSTETEGAAPSRPGPSAAAPALSRQTPPPPQEPALPPKPEPAMAVQPVAARPEPATRAVPAEPEPAPPTTARPEPAPPPVAPAVSPPAPVPAIHFRTGQFTLDAPALEQLRRVARTARRHREVGLECRGHTDHRGAPQRNQELSRKRAEYVAGHLGRLGVQRERIKVKWFGDKKPLSEEDTPEAWARNRRVEIRWR